MGLFDSVTVPCPDCGTYNDFQSKGGDCMMDTYTLEDVPADVLLDVNRHPVSCRSCGTPYHVRAEITVKTEIIKGPLVHENNDSH